MTKEKALDKVKKLENVIKFTDEEIMYFIAHYDEVTSKCEYLQSILSQFPRIKKKEKVEIANRIEAKHNDIEKANKVM